MYRSTLIALSFVLTAQTAHADQVKHFTVGETIAVSTTVLCDTFEQIDSIATAQQEGWLAAVSKYREWNMTMNDLNQPACYALSGQQWIGATIIAEAGMYENAIFADGSIATAYTVAVMWEDRNGNEYAGYILSQMPVLEKATITTTGDLL